MLKLRRNAILQCSGPSMAEMGGISHSPGHEGLLHCLLLQCGNSEVNLIKKQANPIEILVIKSYS